MRLALYSSTPRGDEPNYVAIQDPVLAAIPTVLVCPMLRQMEWADFRAKVELGDATYIVACDLARPVHRQGLRHLGELSEKESTAVMKAFGELLARDL
jgi:mRNA-degrading endonuclease toxin of MazEF toxin-antitoxin module